MKPAYNIGNATRSFMDASQWGPAAFRAAIAANTDNYELKHTTGQNEKENGHPI